MALNIDNDNVSHKSVSLDNTNSIGVQDINVKKDASLGLDLLMNKSKTGEVGSPKNSDPEVKEIRVEEPKTNDEFNLDKLLAEENGKLSDNSSENTANVNLGLNEVKLDDIQEVNLSNDIFKIDSQNDTAPQVKIIEDTPTPTPTQPTINLSPSFSEAPKAKTFAEIQNEKFEILCNLERLEARGVKVSKAFNMDSNFEEMKTEYERIKRKLEVDKSVRFQRKMLVAFVTAIEFLNSKFDPAGVKLDGWSESIHENVHDYDDIFEELHEKYKSKAHMAPELRLILMLGGSGFMFHLTQTLFKTSLPGVGDIMKQNPDLMNQFAKAAAGSMGGENAGLGNLMSDLMGGGGGGGFGQQQRESSRPEMRGPPNIEDILGKVNTTRRTNVDIDNVSNFSESDMEAARNINIKRKRKNGNEITLNF